MSSIKIKKSKQGSLHKHLGVPQGKKIPASKLKIKSTDSPAIRKKKQFAINAKKWKHEEGGLIPEYSWGGVLADTAAGAGMGAMAGAPLGGIGALPGAIIGGAGAFLKGAVGEITGNKQEKLELAQQRIAQANNSFNTMMGDGIQNPFTATFAMGGRVGMVNAEIEKGETALSPDGTMHKFQLPSHANSVGDNFKSFDPGTMIFSDKLKFSKNKTFAQEQNRWLKLSAKADKTIKNPGSTFLNKRTANLNKQNSLKMSVDLFGKQEAMKMSKGGSVPGKFWGGGTAGNPNNQFPLPGGMYENWNQTGYPISPIVVQPQKQNYQRQTGFPFQDELFNNMQVQQAAYQPGADNTGWRMLGVRDAARPTAPVAPPTGGGARGTGTVLSGPESYGIKTAGFNRDFSPPSGLDTLTTGTPIVPSLNQYGTTGFNPVSDASKAAVAGNLANTPGVNVPDGGMDWGGIGMQALALAPDIYNLGHALFSKPEKIERNRYFNPYTNQIRSRMNDRRFNIDPILAGNRNANAVYNRNVSNAAGGDRSRLMSNLLAGMTGRQGADAAAYSQKINMDNQYLGQQAEMDYNLGAMNAQALAMRDDINARNLAAKRNFGASAASGMQRYALNQMQMNNQMNSQNAYLDVLQRVNPFFNQWLGINDLRNYNKR